MNGDKHLLKGTNQDLLQKTQDNKLMLTGYSGTSHLPFWGWNILKCDLDVFSAVSPMPINQWKRFFKIPIPRPHCKEFGFTWSPGDSNGQPMLRTAGILLVKAIGHIV